MPITLALAAGCRQAERAVEAGGGQARRWIGHVEPTGTLAETDARKEVWQSIKDRLDKLDIERFNNAVDETATAVAKISARLDGIPVEDLTALANETAAAARSLREQVEAAGLDEAVKSIQTLSQSVNDSVATLDVEQANSLLSDTRALLARLDGTVTQLDEQLVPLARNTDELARRAADLLGAVQTERITATVEKLDRAATDAEAALAPIRQSAHRFPATTEQLGATLRWLQTAAQITAAATALFGLCAIAWLLRLTRSPKAPRVNPAR